MDEESIDPREDLPAAAFGLGVAATLLASGVILRVSHGELAAVALSVAILWLAASLDQGGSRLETFLFGLAVGIGGWGSLPILFCSTLACAWLLVRWPAVARRRSFAVIALLGFLAGALLGARAGHTSQAGFASHPTDVVDDAFWEGDPGD
jgi:hypothetical protein